MRSLAVALSLSCGLLTACAHRVQPQASADLTLVRDTALPAPASTNLISPTREYRIAPSDKLRIDVYGLDISRDVEVDSAGQIAVALAGTVSASGRTPAELAAVISDKLREAHVRHPQVSVNLIGGHSQTLTVDGEVKEPGQYSATGHMTLMRSIAAAKGLTEFAKLNVVVLRTVGSQRMAGVYNLESIRVGRYADPEVYPDDVILVTASDTARIFHKFIQLAPAVLTPLVYVIRP